MTKESVAPQVLVPLYTEMARRKLHIKWAENSVTAAQRVVAEKNVVRFPYGAEKASVTDQLTGRRITARKVQRRKYQDRVKNPAAELRKRFPEAARAVSSETQMTEKYTTAFYSSRAWTARFPGILEPLAVPGFRPDVPWAVHDFVTHGRNFIKNNQLEHDALQDKVVSLLPQAVNLDELRSENIKHVFGQGLAYHVRYQAAGAQQRVSWVKLEQRYPDIFAQFKKLEAVEDSVIIGFTMASDDFSWDNGDDDSEADSSGWGLP